jgi:hypothetical protein
MNVALLIGDSEQGHFLHIDGNFQEMYEKYLLAYNPGVRVTAFDVMAGTFPDLNQEYDGFICTGSSASVNNNKDWITELRWYGRRVSGIRICGFKHP